MERLARANGLMDWLAALRSVRSVQLYGSFAAGTADALSDLDLAVTVSGDNGAFLLELPGRLAGFSPVLFADFAPSLAPEKYVLSVCLWPDMPFLLVDFTIRAEPHCPSVTRAMLMEANDSDAHLCKLFCANLKHFLRESAVPGGTLACSGDIRKMWRKLYGDAATDVAEGEMLRCTYAELQRRRPEFRGWLDGFAPYLP